MTQDWAARVRAAMPDLTFEKAEVNQEGLMNDVVVVDGGWVVRFAKTEAGAGRLGAELDLLDYIAPRVSLAVPRPQRRGPDWAAYQFLEGEPLLFEDILELDPAGQDALAAQLGAFLHQLHSLPTDRPGLPATRAMVTRAEFQEFLVGFRTRAYPLMQAHQIHWIERMFERAFDDPGFFSQPPAVIHGDLAPYHILRDKAGIRLTGVIDFGMSGLGDPASDFGILISLYGEGFVSRMAPAYPGLDRVLPRARFYAQTIELEWVQRGLESGETFWFLAHLGGARDVRQT